MRGVPDQCPVKCTEVCLKSCKSCICICMCICALQYIPGNLRDDIQCLLLYILIIFVFKSLKVGKKKILAGYACIRKKKIEVKFTVC